MRDLSARTGLRSAGPPFNRPAVMMVVVAAVLVMLTAGVAPVSAARPTPGKAAVPPRTLGVAMPGLPYDLSGLRALTAQLGQAPGQVTWYAAWATAPDFPAAAAADIAATGAVPEVTWEPWDPAAGTYQPAYALSRIAAGAYDGYVRRWAQQVRSYGKPVVIRFAHEMNGDWYPWAEQANGNRPGDYVAAWRRVVGVFAAAKATNVTWSWAPNVPYAGSTPLSGLYPGDAYVGRVGLDGYNWSTLQAGSSWQSFGEVFGAGIAQLTSLTSKPVYVSETGCPETGGDKAAWIRDMWSWLASHPEVRGVTWFSFDKEADWRIDSSDASLQAYATGARSFS